MKRIFIYLAMALAASALFVSCNKDKEADLGKAAAGTYNVTATITMAGMPSMAPVNAKLVITRLTNTTAKFEIQDLIIQGVGETAIPVSVQEVELGGTASNVTVDQTVSIAFGASTVDGTIKGNITPEAAENINLTIVLTHDSMNISVKITDAQEQPQ